MYNEKSIVNLTVYKSDYMVKLVFKIVCNIKLDMLNILEHNEIFGNLTSEYTMY